MIGGFTTAKPVTGEPLPGFVRAAIRELIARGVRFDRAVELTPWLYQLVYVDGTQTRTLFAPDFNWVRSQRVA